MALKFINKRFSREKQTQSMIQPNDTLNIQDISKYQQILLNKEDKGFMGLKRAFEEKLLVSIKFSENSGNEAHVTGTISHFDENFEQLVLIVGSSLKRISFSQISKVDYEGNDTAEDGI